MNHPLFFHTSCGDLGPNRAYKIYTEIFYASCRKLSHLGKYSTLYVENCEKLTADGWITGRLTDRPTKRGTEATSSELRNTKQIRLFKCFCIFCLILFLANNFKASSSISLMYPVLTFQINC